MATKDTATCSICGKEAPMIEMSVNKVFEEERCRECMERYGDVPFETLRASLARFDMDIIRIPRDDLDDLVVLQKEKIALNRETEKKVENLQKAKWVFRREKKIESAKEKAKMERNRINQEIDDLIKVIKTEMEAPSWKNPTSSEKVREGIVQER